jgi:hypothetical protein
MSEVFEMLVFSACWRYTSALLSLQIMGFLCHVPHVYKMLCTTFLSSLA